MAVLSESEREVLQELMNIAAGKAADTMARLFGKRIGINIAAIQVLSQESLLNLLGETLFPGGAIVEQNFWGDIQGLALLLLPHDETVRLVNQLLDVNGRPTHLSVEDRGVLSELGNVILSACVSTFVQQLQRRARFQLPEVLTDLNAEQVIGRVDLHTRRQNAQVILLSTHFEIREQRLNAWIALILALETQPLLNALHAIREPSDAH